MKDERQVLSPAPKSAYRIGYICDLPANDGWPNTFPEGLEVAFEEAVGKGILDRPVEVVQRNVFGQPYADGRAIVQAYRDLVENEGVIGVTGPHTTDNALAVLPETERAGVPVLSICGTQLFVGHWAFNLSNGGMAEEPAVAAAWLKGEGHSRIGVVREFPSQIGEEYMHYFRYSAADNDLSIAIESLVSPVADEMEILRSVQELRDANVDAIVYWGLGLVTPLFNPALEKLDWWPPRIMSTAFVRAERDPEIARRLEGWYGVAQYDERNVVLQKALELWKQTKGKAPVASSCASIAIDVGRALARGLGRMRIATPAGLRDALETIRRLPAATGAPGTVITFGPEDHRGFKGADFLVVRRAEGGTSHFVCTAPVE
jgi:branched-chain amino acid transport system substrate-binding protein